MDCQLLDESLLRKKSKEEKVPFENLITIVVLEDILKKIYDSEYADYFLIKNSVVLSSCTYRNKMNRRLNFCIRETKSFLYKKSEIGCIFAKLFRNIKKDCIHWNYNITEKKIKDKTENRSEFFVNIIATVFSVQIPVEIRIEKYREENMLSVQKEILLKFALKEKLSLNCYPSEGIAAEKFLNIIDKLELLSDLSDYMELYQILKTEQLSGRKISELLMEGCKDNGIEVTQQRFDILLSYYKNSYMMKKWKSYLRHEKRKEPKWEDVIEIVGLSFQNIWDSLCKNVIYMGDWMPELGRYID